MGLHGLCQLLLGRGSPRPRVQFSSSDQVDRQFSHYYAVDLCSLTALGLLNAPEVLPSLEVHWNP